MRRITLLLSLLLIFTLCSGKEYNMSALGIKDDGKSLNTKLIQQAIDKAYNEGGGTLIFQKGKYLTGSLFLKSNVHIILQKGAVLLGSTNPADYRSINVESTTDNARSDNSQIALILGKDLSNVSIRGKGCIDGQGLSLALTIDSLHHAGISIDKKYNYKRMRTNETARPKLILIYKSADISFEGIKLTNSSCWGVTFELCKDISVHNVKVVNRAYWNNDGFDFTDCKNVIIKDCDVNSADDGICLKSYNADSFNDNISIENCTIRSSASAVKFGTASWGGFKNITIKNINVFDTFRSAIAIESVDGGKIENIHVSNITAKNTGNAFFIRLGHRAGKSVGIIKDIIIDGMNVEVPFSRPDIQYDLRGPEVDFFHNPFPASITGIKGHYIENIILRNINIKYPGRASKSMAYIPISDLDRVPEKAEKYPEFSMFGELPSWGIYMRHINNITLDNVKLSLRKSDYRPMIVADDAIGLSFNKVIGAKDNDRTVLRDATLNNPYNDNGLNIIEIKK